MPSNIFLKASAVSQRLYDREVGIYNQFHPLLRKFRSDVGLNYSDVPLNVPDIYYTNLFTTSDGRGKENCPIVLVLEDLQSQGFSMADKRVGCTFQEAQATLTTLASYHALSIAVTRQWKTSSGDYALPEQLSFVREGTLFDAKGCEMLGTTVPIYIEIMRKMGHVEAASWLESEAESVVEVMTPEDVRQCGPLSCLLHADCWINNMMYRSTEDQVVEMRLVDWQITRLGHPVGDCLHFFFSSTSPEMRADHFTQLMEDYFNQLQDNLGKLGIHLEQEVYTQKEFRLDLIKRLRWALFMALLLFPLILDDSMSDEVDNCEGEDLIRLANEQASQRDIFDTMTEQMKRIFTVEKVMKNQLLCDRMSKLILEVKSVLGS
jgi:hypothetical protein